MMVLSVLSRIYIYTENCTEHNVDMVGTELFFFISIFAVFVLTNVIWIEIDVKWRH